MTPSFIPLGTRPASPGYASATRALRQNLLAQTYIPLLDEETRYIRQTANEDIIKNSNPLAFQPIRDTDAEKAWRLGWTGRGVKIGVLDDFVDRDIKIDRGRNITHGEAVASISQQIAPESTLATQHISFSCSQTADGFDQQVISGLAYFQRNGHHIVNNSWGADRYFTDRCADKPNPRLFSIGTWESFIASEKDSQPTKGMIIPIADDDALNANMLFVFAAGNNGQDCSGGIPECNLLAATIDTLRQDDGVTDAGERVLFVGSLSDASRISRFGSFTPVLADYSHPAGTMVNDYIVAHDDISFYGDGSGTSFAAPRVAAAAALVRQKFPSLNGPRLKHVLVATADDLGAPGPDPVFGSGRLNIMNALSPINEVTAK